MASRTFRAEHVGSLLRPPSLIAEVERGQEDVSDATSLTEQQDAAILDILARQRSVGVDVYTDGEFRRTGYMGGFLDSVEGFVAGGAAALAWKGGTGTEPTSPNLRSVKGRLRVKSRIAETEAQFMREHSPGPFKVTLPSPATYTIGSWHEAETGYESRQQFITDAAGILSNEARQLGIEGVPYIQVDSPNYTHLADPALFEELRAEGFDEDAMDAAIAGDNAVLDAARAAGAVTGVHLCRGNSMGRWLAEGGYDPIAEKVFTGLRCDRLLLEYDSDRAGGFEPLRFVDGDKIVVLGLISSKQGDLEWRDDILRRIDEATTYVPIEQLAISPQCGFASAIKGNPITEDQQWAKLALVASIADEVWGSERSE